METVGGFFSASGESLAYPVWKFLDFLAEKTRRWHLWEWVLLGLALQFFFIFTAQGLLDLLPPETIDQENELLMVSTLDFVEFQEMRSHGRPSDSQDLSDRIIERDVLLKKQNINWENATDPVLDLSQRYMARLLVNISPDDYPLRARRANPGTVVVAVSIYIGANGTIQDVKIRRVSSAGGAATPFTEDFKNAARKIIMNKTKLLNSPYHKGGAAKDFVWDTTITFILQ